jgi:hypothetical protein
MDDLEPLLWSITGFDDVKDEAVLRQCRLLERVFDELALDGGQLSAGDRSRAEAHHASSPSAGDQPAGGEAPAAKVVAPPHFTSLAYGEVLFEPFAELLLRKVWPHWQRQHPDGGEWLTFVDLGSGLGKALWVARLVPGGFAKKAVGIELLTPLHDAAVAAHQRLQHTTGVLPYVARTHARTQHTPHTQLMQLLRYVRQGAHGDGGTDQWRLPGGGLERG